MEKTCTGCGARKPLEEFKRAKKVKSGYAAQCKECHRRESAAYFAANRKKQNKACATWVAKNRDRNNANVRRARYKRMYGITLEELDKLYAAAHGKCQICDAPLRLGGTKAHGRAVLDHDHHTKAVRGILCSSCNSGIGHLKDSLARVLRAAQYLRGVQ